MDELDDFDDKIEALEASLGGAAAVAAAFDHQLKGMRETMGSTGREVRIMSSGISRGLRKSFDGLVFDGLKLSDALRGVSRSITDSAYNAAIKPVTSHFGGLIATGVEGFIQGVGSLGTLTHGQSGGAGGAFTRSRVLPFAHGGSVAASAGSASGAANAYDGAGPMTRARVADSASGGRNGGGVNVTMNISTPDSESFRRSQSQIAAQMSRVLARGQRNR